MWITERGMGSHPSTGGCISKMGASYHPASVVIGGTGWVPLWLSFHMFCKLGRNSNILALWSQVLCDRSPGIAVDLDGLPVGCRLICQGASGK